MLFKNALYICWIRNYFHNLSTMGTVKVSQLRKCVILVTFCILTIQFSP